MGTPGYRVEPEGLIFPADCVPPSTGVAAAALLEELEDEGLATTAARTLVHFVLGHATDEQLRRQAGSAGALDADDLDRDFTAEVTTGIDLVLAGLRARV